MIALGSTVTLKFGGDGRITGRMETVDGERYDVHCAGERHVYLPPAAFTVIAPPDGPEPVAFINECADGLGDA